MFSHALVRMAVIVGLSWSMVAAGAITWLIFSTPEGDLAGHWWRFFLIVLGPPVPLVLFALLWVLALEPRSERWG